MYEHHKKPLASNQIFYQRVVGNIVWSLILISASLFIGILGYHLTENLGWLDSLLNASMILGGMGPVDTLKTSGGKLFASFYALFSGVVFLITMSVVLAPILHRFLHKFHLDENEK
jgi:hypothetical protein